MVVCAACWAFTDKSTSLLTMSQLAFSLAFAVNHPHFLSSYVLLYNDFRKNLGGRMSYIWAAVVVPVLLFGFLVYAYAAGRGDLLGHSVNLMFFLVGWHYVKQVFGCVIVTSARRKIYYAQNERRIILCNLFALWAISWLQSQTTTQAFGFYGINYSGLGLSTSFSQAAYIMLALSGVGLISMHLNKYVKTGVKPSLPGAAAVTALYVWYLPTFAHPAFAYLIPFFHSLQYLTFVWSFKKNQVHAHIQQLKVEAWRAAFVQQFIGYAAVVTVLGAMAFEFVPKALDSQQFLNNAALGTSPFLAAFLIFINVHHYFIDSVMWRSNNEEVKKYLFAPPTAVPATPVTLKRAA